MSMTQEKMYMNVDDVCAVLGVSKAFAYRKKWNRKCHFVKEKKGGLRT